MTGVSKQAETISVSNLNYKFGGFMILPMKNSGSKFVAISALALLPILSIAASAQDAPTPTAPPQARGEARAFSLFVGGSYLGVQTENVTKDNFSKYSLREPRGVAVLKVSENSPAAAAGVRDGDVIVRFDGEEVKSVSKLQRLIQEVAPDQKARVTVLRDGREQEITVTMGKRSEPNFQTFGNFPQGGVWTLPPGELKNLPRIEGLPRAESLPRDFKFEMRDLPDMDGNVFVFPGAASRRLGISVSPLTKQLGDYFGVSEGKGLLVEDVREQSAAAKAGLRAGDVITEVEGEQIARQADLIRALNKKAEGEISMTIVRDRARQTVRVTPEAVKPATAPAPATKFKI
jgi:serine protease Do